MKKIILLCTLLTTLSLSNQSNNLPNVEEQGSGGALVGCIIGGVAGGVAGGISGAGLGCSV